MHLVIKPSFLYNECPWYKIYSVRTFHTCGTVWKMPVGSWVFPNGSGVKNLSASEGDKRDSVSNPGWGRSPGGGNGNPLQYSCLESPMDWGAWWATIHGVTMSRTRLSTHTRTHTHTPQEVLSFSSSVQALHVTVLSLAPPGRAPQPTEDFAARAAEVPIPSPPGCFHRVSRWTSL